MQLASARPHATDMSPKFALASLAALAACGGEPDLVVYVSHDQIHAEPLIRRFEAETGLSVRAEFDVESSKTIGLVHRIREEKARARCDVFWNNEVAHTVALADEGFFAVYDSPSAADIPESFRDPSRRWTGFAARARVFIVNTERLDPATIDSMHDLVDPRFAGMAGMARPVTGTTLTHMAALFEVLGEIEALAYLGAIRDANERGELALATGNGHVKSLVQQGELAFGWTDTDDFNVAREAGAPVAIVYPDQDGAGTLLIPNTVAVLAGAPRPENARRFIDWLLAPAVEAELALSRSAQIPVRPGVPRPAHVVDPARLKLMHVDFATLGAHLSERQKTLQEMFVR